MRNSILPMKKSEGFTLIEILLVVLLISVIIFTVAIVAINPQKNLADTRNSTRTADVNQILNAITQYAYQEGNSLSDFGPLTECSAGADRLGTGAGALDLSTYLVDEYIVEIPQDPMQGSEADTGYTVCLTGAGRVQVDAPYAENSEVISVSR